MLTAEAMLYKLILAQVKCVVSVGHRSQLVKLHTHVLEARAQPDGTTVWTLFPSREYKPHEQRG